MPRLPGGREVLDWLPFHAIAWIQDERIRTMSPEARGAFVTLLSHEWIEGSLPTDEWALSCLAGWDWYREQRFRHSPDDDGYSWAAVWRQLAGHFVKHPKLDRLVNPTLERVRREQNAKRQAARNRQRASRDGHTAVTVRSRPRSRSKKVEVDMKSSRPGRETWVTALGRIWEAVFSGTPPYAQIGAHLKPMREHPELAQRWETYLRQTEARFASPARFAQTFGSWRNDGKPRGPQYQSVDEADRKAGLLS